MKRETVDPRCRTVTGESARTRNVEGFQRDGLGGALSLSGPQSPYLAAKMLQRASLALSGPVPVHEASTQYLGIYLSCACPHPRSTLQAQAAVGSLLAALLPFSCWVAVFSLLCVLLSFLLSIKTPAEAGVAGQARNASAWQAQPGKAHATAHPPDEPMSCICRGGGGGGRASHICSPHCPSRPLLLPKRERQPGQERQEQRKGECGTLSRAERAHSRHIAQGWGSTVQQPKLPARKMLFVNTG